MQERPELASTFLVWLLADLYEDLPEVGDADKPTYMRTARSDRPQPVRHRQASPLRLWTTRI